MAYVTMTTRSAGYVVPASEWNQLIANDEACAVAGFTTAGDLFYGTGSKAGSRLGIGSTAYSRLRTNSGKTAPEWAMDGWNPVNPPASANANDDEFNTGSLSANWTEFDPNSDLTVSVGDVGCKFVQASRAGNNNVGIYKTLPAGNFTIWMKAITLATLAAYSYASIILWETPTDTSKKLLTVQLHRDATVYAGIEAVEWTNYTTSSSTKLATAETGSRATNHLWIRLRRNGTNYYVDISQDGVGWISANAGAAITLSFTPSAMGIGSNNGNTGATQTVLFPFFRYLGSDVGAAGIVGGNR
jgi:hypothetical protein